LIRRIPSCPQSGGGLSGGRRRFAVVLAAVGVAAVFVGNAHASLRRSIVAQANGRDVAVYHRRGARQPFITLRNPNSEGSRLAFLVKSRVAGWDLVYLPMRPDGSTGWIRETQVDLAYDPYRVVVSLGGHSIAVYDGGRIFYRARAGVGRSITRTPTGVYYIVDLLQQADPHGVYGPYAFGLSAFSNVLYSFGGGPGQIGLHGTNEPARLGTDVSHGCIRISNAGITKLARVLPLGTPVIIRP
jgi:lipoprotein-anchoring transpeptidase ErfK/SrfK